jgi:type II secretory pathway predicted ATPase ExeA
METPEIKPLSVTKFNTKQSRYAMCAELPMRSIILGPSGSGKSVLLQNMIMTIYKDCFEKIYIISPTIHFDKSWEPVKKYITEKLKMNPDKEHCFMDKYEQHKLDQIVETQEKVSDYMKEQKYKSVYQILIVLDDVADNPALTRHDKLLHSLYLRGRHSFISTIVSTQVFTALSSIIRKNITQLYVYRLRNFRDLETLLEELSALVDKKTLLEIYQQATQEKHSFLYINLMETDLNKMFTIRFDKRILIE